MKTQIFISHNHADSLWSDWIYGVIKDLNADIYYDQLTYENYTSSAGSVPLSMELAQRIQTADIAIIIGSNSYARGIWSQHEYSAITERISKRENLQIISYWVGGEKDEAYAINYSRHPLLEQNDENAAIVKNNISALISNIENNNGDGKGPSSITSASSDNGNLSLTKASVIEEFDKFLLLLQKHQSHLEDFAPVEDRTNNYFGRQSPASGLKNIPERVPNFILCQKEGGADLFLCIVDSNSEVDFARLSSQHTSENEKRFRRSRYIKIDDRISFGFKYDFIHPMFHVLHEGKSLEVVIDLNIYFHSLFVPRSRIVIPTDRNRKQSVSISSFIRAINDFHGEENVYKMNCTRGNWREDQFYELIRNVYANTRFAPTPSNSLHLGSVRAAIMPFLLSKVDESPTCNLLRFDDTNKSSTKSEAYDLIKSDLAWLGLLPPKEKIFRQSSEQSQEVYEYILSLLTKAGFTTVTDGEVHLTVPEKDEVYLWLDLVEGPRVRRGSIPWKNIDTREFQNLKLQRSDGSFLYKFTGTVDDMFLTSHIVRDESQLAQGLTDRQAFIASRIRKAIELETTTSRNGKKVLPTILTEYLSSYINRHRLPFPLMSPPAYYHFGVVTDKHGRRLAKRLQSQSVFELRENNRTLPEAIVAVTVYSILYTHGKWASNWNLALENLYSIGLAGFYETLAADLSIERFAPSRMPYQYSISTTKKWERQLITSCSATLLNHLIERANIFNGDKSAENVFLKAVWKGPREYFSCWSDVISLAELFCERGIRSVISRAKRSDLADSEKALLNSKNGTEYSRAIKSLSNSSKRKLREVLFGWDDEKLTGIRLAHLPHFIPYSTFNKINKQL